MAYRPEELSAGESDAGWNTGRRLCNMTHLYGHFYKVLWKLLMGVKVGDHPGSAEDKKNGPKVSNGKKKAKKASFAIVYAGCREGDGASTMAFNSASAFAAYSSRSVVLVDGNMRDPILHYQFPTKEARGLSDVVRGKASLQEAIAEIDSGRFYFLRAGERVNNPVALYESSEFTSLVEQLRATYDLLIFDSASLIGNPETSLLAGAADGLVMVLQAEKTRWEVARSARRDLESARVPIIGAILNKKQFVIPEAIYRLL